MKINILMLGLLSLVSCSLSKVDYKMPTTRFQSPEVTGGAIFQMDIKGRANVNFASSNRVTSSAHIQDMLGPVDTDNLTIESSGQLGLLLDISIFDRVDMYWNILINSPVIGGFKWQFLGKTENAYSRGWKGSVTAGWGMANSDLQKMPIGQGPLEDDDYYLKNNMKVWDVSLQFGYRFNERFILYANGFYNGYKSDITLIPAEEDTTVTNIALDSTNLGGLVGIKYYFKNKVSYANLEVGGAKATVDVGDVTNSDLSLGVNFGWIFE